MSRTSRNQNARTRKPAVQVTVIAWAGLDRAVTGGLVLLLALVLFSGLLVVSSSHQNRAWFTELQALKNAHNELQVQRGQLLIEQSTFGLEGRIEQKAIEQLQMQVPALSDIVMVRND
ncbi:MAG: cell division protein FtsL [Pseudohongiellaceae bacterium]